MTVAELIDILSRMPQDQVVAIACEVSHGLDYAHPVGFVAARVSEQTNKAVVIEGNYNQLSDLPGWIDPTFDDEDDDD